MTDLEIITRKEQDGVTTIALKGIVDAYSYAKLEKILNNLIKQKAYKLIVDLSQVDYMVSHGIGILIGVLGVVQKNGGNIVLLNPKPAVMEILELLGLNHFFTIIFPENNPIGTLQYPGKVKMPKGTTK
jgi:anti-anti-sigma factor